MGYSGENIIVITDAIGVAVPLLLVLLGVQPNIPGLVMT